MNNEKPLEQLVGGYSNTAIFRKIAFIGDSLSSGEFESLDPEGKRHYHDLYDYSWGQFIARQNGLLAYNFSRGGMTAKWYLDSFAEEKGFWDPNKACQAYVIALGVNDVYNQKMKVGEAADITADVWEGERPFISYYAEIVRKYKEIRPDAKFFFVTVPKEAHREHQAAITEQLVQAMYDLAEYFDNSYVIDLYRYGPLYDAEFRKKYFMHGHMNPMGYLLTARLVDSYIDYIIRTHPDDFKNVGFVTTGIQYW